MPPASARPYSHPDDLPVMIEFLKSVRPPAWSAEYPGLRDLKETMGRPSIQNRTRLWFTENERLAAFAFLLEPYNQLVFEIDPRFEREIEGSLIAWGMKSAAREEGEQDSLITSCREDDPGRTALLERQGFTLLPECTLQMARRLEAPIPPPRLPEGFNIRPVNGEQEVEDLVALNRLAFGTAAMTREARLAVMRTPDYDPALDLVATAPGGRLAALCTCSISSAENGLSGMKIGHTDPVATHPDHRRLGLARALLMAGARLLQERGMELAVLGTDRDNRAMQAAARSAGFEVYSKRIWFEKTSPHA